MKPKKYDFGGWATRNNLRCSDGRTIVKDAFKDCDGMKRPLVWNHQHNSPENVLGHAILENREEGVYAYCSFNDTPSGLNAKKIVEHGDVVALSIYANQLKQDGSRVLHGAIREVSLVLAGANPGAFINSIMAHGEETDEAEIYNGLDYIEAPSEEDTPDEDAGEPAEDDSEPIVHADGKDDEKKEEGAGETLEDVFNTLTQKQKNTVYAMVGDVADRGGEENHSNENKGGNDDMKHNAFEGNKPEEN